MKISRELTFISVFWQDREILTLWKQLRDLKAIEDSKQLVCDYWACVRECLRVVFACAA